MSDNLIERRFPIGDYEDITICDAAEITVYSTNGYENAVIFEVRAY